MTGFVFVASTLCGANAEQHNFANAATFGYVVNAQDNTVSVIDAASNKVVATIPVGGFPQAVATTPDGAHAYVANSFDNTVSVIETASNTVVETIPVGSAPSGVAVTPDETRSYEDDDGSHQPLAYVTNGGDNTVSVIDTASNTVVATIPVGNTPTGVAITSDGTHAYVGNFFDDSVSVIETGSNTVVDTIPGLRLPTELAITPNGTQWNERNDRRHPFAYVANSADFSHDTISVIDTTSNKVVATIPVEQLAYGVAITPDGTHAYVTNEAPSTVSVIDTATNKVVATIAVAGGSVGIAITSDGPTHPSTTIVLISLSPM
jgi:YVTN family beta-propeller protein